MKTRVFKAVLLALTVCMAVSVIVGCNGAENTNGGERKFYIEQVTPVESPIKADYSTESGASFRNIGELFSKSSAVVKGKVVKTTEYRLYTDREEGLDEDDETDKYFTAVELRVEKFYGGKDLIYRGEETIVFKYDPTSYEYFEALRKIEAGDECVVFLIEIEEGASEQTDLMKQHVDYTYAVICLKEAVGYDAQRLMKFAEETREFYQLSEIEKVINDNKDKINNYN